MEKYKAGMESAGERKKREDKKNADKKNAGKGKKREDRKNAGKGEKREDRESAGEEKKREDMESAKERKEQADMESQEEMKGRDERKQGGEMKAQEKIKDGSPVGGGGEDQALSEIFSYYSSMTSPSSQENIVSMLREIQELCGFISDEHKQLASEAAGVGTQVIDCIMKLYKSLKPAPYKHRITVCTGAACKSHKKQEKLLEHLKKELGIKGQIPGTGALSADKRVLLETRSCLKRCRTAPNVMIDGELAEKAEEKWIMKKIGE